MSRIGKKPVTFSDNVKISLKDNVIEVNGPKGKLSQEIKGDIDIHVKNNEVIITRKNEQKRNRELHGLYRALINNMVIGVTEGYEKRLEIVGIGYKAELKEKYLALQLGYSHQIIFLPPEEIKLQVPAPNSIIVSGADRQLVGEVAAKIRSFRPPEPYKGKGVKYENEIIRRKAGKAAAK